MTTATETVREIARKQPASIRVFEQFGIEYCCGGRKPLVEACAANDVNVDTVIAALEAASRNEKAPGEDWAHEPLAKLAEHIVTKHHAYCKNELPRLSGLAAKVVNQHGGTNPELAVIQTKLAQLAEELGEHLADEEVAVFPMIVNLERSRASQDAGVDESGLSESGVSVGNPVALMVEGHDDAGVLLAEIRGLSRDFIAPEYACPTYHAFYDGLREFELDLHRHVHLENNILFPRAIELEASSN